MDLSELTRGGTTADSADKEAAERDVIFEIDVAESKITVVRAGAWQNSIPADTSYVYDLFLRRFLDKYVDRDDRDMLWQAISFESIFSASNNGHPLVSAQFRAVQPGMEEYEWYQINILTPHGGRSYGTMLNIHREKEEELVLLHRADHDSLTDLLNRTAFERETSPMFADTAVTGFFMIVDIDDFKDVNDTKGHQYGDTVLRTLSKHISSVLPPNAVRGRFGGDEFVSFCPGVTDAQEIERMLKTLEERCASGREVAPFTVSCGVSLCPDNGRTLSSLLASADRALYYVKQHGKSSFAVFDESMPLSQKYGNIKESSDEETRLPESKPRMLEMRMDRLRKSIMNGTLVLSIIAIVLVLITLLTVHGVNKMTERENTERLDDVALALDKLIIRDINSATGGVEPLAEAISANVDSMDKESFYAFLEEQRELLGFSSIAAVDFNGNCYADGKWVEYPRARNNIRYALVTQECVYSKAVYVGGGYVIYCVAPVKVFDAGDIRVAGIICEINVEECITDSLNGISQFYGTGAAQVVMPNGNVLAYSGDTDIFPQVGSIYNALMRVELDTKPEKFMEIIATGGEGQCTYARGGRKCVLSCHPSTVRDWYIVTEVPQDMLGRSHGRFFLLTIVACIASALIIFLIMSGVVLAQVKQKMELADLAYDDTITGGISRAMFVRECRRLLGENVRKYSMVYINFEHFKLLNDCCGREAADSVLKYAYSVFSQNLTDNECCSRLVSDHFAVLLATQDYFEISEMIKSWNSRIIQFGRSLESPYTISLSFGIYNISEPDMAIDVMLDRSNSARKAALAKNTESETIIGMYDRQLRERIKEEREMEAHMEHSLEAGDFRMYLQPQCDAQTGEIVGFEALVRWFDDGRLLMPGRFIPLFERNGFIIKLDLYMFGQACRAVRHMMDTGAKPVRIAVNVSRIHMLSSNFLPKYVNIWRRYNIPAEYIEFEFTETAMFDNIERFNQIIDEIHALGFKCSMDDFGSGYSSLNLLGSINVDIIKLDKSFLGKDEKLGERERIIISNVIDLASSLGIGTIAEGIETQEQHDFLRGCGCDIIQGFLLGKPMPTEKALELIGGMSGADSDADEDSED